MLACRHVPQASSPLQRTFAKSQEVPLLCILLGIKYARFKFAAQMTYRDLKLYTGFDYKARIIQSLQVGQLIDLCLKQNLYWKKETVETLMHS